MGRLPTVKMRITPYWHKTDLGLELHPPHLTDRVLLDFFQSESWADTLPIPQKVLIGSNRDSIDPYILGTEYTTRDIEIPLYTVESFKGLEADNVILFVLSPKDNFKANLYVGLSRAKFYLHLVINTQTHSQMGLSDFV